MGGLTVSTVQHPAGGFKTRRRIHCFRSCCVVLEVNISLSAPSIFACALFASLCSPVVAVGGDRTVNRTVESGRLEIIARKPSRRLKPRLFLVGPVSIAHLERNCDLFVAVTVAAESILRAGLACRRLCARKSRYDG